MNCKISLAMKDVISRLRGLVITALLVALVVPGLVALEAVTAPAAQAANLSLDAPVVTSVSSPAGNQLTVNWTAPTNPSAVSITGYQVEHSADGVTWTTDTSALAANSTTFTITGLTPNTKYLARVAANSAGGLGSYGYQWTKIYATSSMKRSGTSIAYDAGFGLGGSDAAANNASALYSRIRYLMGVTYGGLARYVDADFSKILSSPSSISETYTTASDLSYLRIPTPDGVAANQFEIQGDVTDLTVLSNDSNVESGSGFTGRVEIWPWDYSTGAQSGLSSALANNSGGLYDDGDTPSMSAAYGSFQLHRLSATAASRKTIFAWNNQAATATPEIGFGDQVGGSGHPDWTFCSRNATCASRTSFSLGIYINVATATLNTIQISYSLNGGSGATPSTNSYSPNSSITLPSSSGISKPGYTLAGWNNGTITYPAGTSYNVGVTPVNMTAQWTSDLVLDYDVTDTASYISGTTLTNRSGSYPNTTLSASNIYNRTSQNLVFGGGTFGTVGSIDAGIFSTGLTLDIYGTLGNDTSSAWERFIDFGKNKGGGAADASYNLDVGRKSSTGQIFLEVFNQTTGTSSIGHCQSTSAVLDNTLRRYTFVLDGSTCSLYVDGVQVSVTNSLSNANGLTIPYGLPLATTWDQNYVAKSNWSGDAATSGSIRSIKLFKSANTPTAIDQVDSGRFVYKTVSYNSPETTTAMPASDVTTGTLTLPLASTASRAGYSLNNWFTTNARSVSAATPGNGYLVPSSTTLYAGWTGSTNNVTWDTQGGTPTIAGTSFVTGGSIASAPATTPVKNDYVFAGWASTIGGTALTFPYSPPELTNITIYAKWTLLTTAQSAISITSTSGQFGTALTLITTGGTGNGAVSYTVANGTASGCQVVAGVVSATSAGTCTVTAMKASDTTYLSTTSAATTVSFSVKPIAVSAGSGNINYGGTFTPTYSAGPLAGSDAIATVSYTYTGTGGTTYGPSTAAPTAVGNYTVTPAVTSLSTGVLTNYSFGYTAGSLIINANVLTAPGTVTAATNTGVAKSLLLTWSAVANASNYTIKVSNGGALIFTIDFAGTSATLTDARLNNGTSYDITVRANGIGNYAASSYSSSVGTASTAAARTITYVYNGADGGNSRASDSYIVGGAAIALPTPTQTNFTFGGWYLEVGLTTLVTGTQTPSSDMSLYAKWTATAYSIDFSPNYGVSVSNTTSVTFGNSTILPTLARSNFVFDGWYTAASGGSKVGNGGASYTPAQTRTLYAHWIQSSLYGVAAGNLSRVGTLTANDIVSGQYSGTLGSNAVTVNLPSGALPAGTVVNLDLITDTSYAQSLLSGTNSYILSIAVSWLALDETVPNTNSGKAVEMTINNASIKAGAFVFSVQGGSVVLLGRAIVDGTVTVQLTSDPSIYVLATVPDAPQSVTATPSTTSSVITWTAPQSNGGETITGYTVTLNTGASCTTTLLSCTFNNLTPGTSYTATVIATNSIGSSLTANASFTVTALSSGGSGSAPALPVTPVVPVIPKEPVVTPIKPIILPVPLVKIVESVNQNNMPVLTGAKIVDPVYFDANSAKLDKNDLATLQKLASTLRGLNGTLLVTGFVKFTNLSKSTMQKMATQRALAVTKQLAALGITATIGYLGYGPNNIKAPKATDRKVEMRWVPAT